MTSLKDIQKSFINSIYKNDESLCSSLIKDSQISKSSRINIYRNNSLSTLKETLKKRYPAIVSLVGEDFFKYCSNQYIKLYPSISGNLDEYGNKFSQFISNFEPAKNLFYLKDIATLEQLMHESYFAKDSKKIDKVAFSKIQLDKLVDIKLKFNYSSYLISSKWPIHRIYLMAMGKLNDNIDVNLGGENILIYRPKFKVEYLSVDYDEFIFLNTLYKMNNLHESFNEAEKINSQFNIGKALEKFIILGVFSDFYFDG